MVVVGHAADLEAIDARERGERHARAKAVGLAKDYVTRPAIGAALIRLERADDDVTKTVAVDIPGGANRIAGLIATRHAAELEAVGAVERRERHARGEAGRLAKYDVTRATKAAALV